MCPVSWYIQGDQCALYLGIYKVISVPCIWECHWYMQAEVGADGWGGGGGIIVANGF